MGSKKKAAPPVASASSRVRKARQPDKPAAPRRTATGSNRRRTGARPSRDPAACTIVARNYLSHARVLAESYLQHHPDGRFYLLVVDGLPDGVDVGVDGVRLVSTSELELSSFYEMCFKYDVTELSTAVKPSLLSLLMERYGEDRALYIDPDILVVRPLAEVVQALERTAIVLTPHLSKPIPSDGHAPSEQDILIAGAYNLGFIGLANSPQTRELLAWWQDRLRDLCRADPRQGLMVDQRWVDLVPTLFPSTELIRDEGYNVAYWNLHARTIGRTGDRYTVNGEPLTFFHFSGFNPLRPGNLSKHQTRHSVPEGSPLAELLAHYAELHLRHGYREASAWRYGLATFDNGLRLDPLLRRLYLDLDVDARRRFGDPFSTTGTGSFLAWATEPRPDVRNLSPFLEVLYRERYDVACAFPDVAGLHHDAYLEWAATQGAQEMGYDPALVVGLTPPPEPAQPAPDIAVPGDTPSTDAATSAASPSRRLPSGVNVCGYIRNESGLGTLTRGYISAIKSMGVEVALKDVSGLSVNRSEDPSVTTFDESHPHPVNLVCINADQHFVVMADDEQFFASKYNIGVWNWELPSFPAEWHDRFDHYDEIWAGSSMIVHALAPVSPVPIIRVPPVLSPVQSGDRERGRQALGVTDDERVFLFMFDFHSYFERKNPLAVIEAFTHAFRPSEPARLVIKCVNGESDQVGLRRLRDASGGHRVQILTDYLPYQRISDLQAACDAYVSLHRSEGIGLTIAEAMALGKPVIATAWSGNVDFMDISNSFPVGFEMVEITEDVGPYRAGQQWADPSIDDSAVAMRQVFDQPDVAAGRGAAASRHMQENFSVERVSRLMADRLTVIERRRVTTERPPAALPARYRGNQETVAPIHEVVATHLPDDAVVAVVSRGAEDLVNIDRVIGWHFPQTEDGTYAGYYPADSTTAIAHLESLVAKGARYFLVPASSGWWLEYYAEFKEHLDARYRLVTESAACTIYELLGSEPVEVLQPDTTVAPLDWTARATIDTTGLSPFLDLIYRLRPDVAAVFPDVAGQDRLPFLDWTRGPGAVEMGYDPRLVDTTTYGDQPAGLPASGAEATAVLVPAPPIPDRPTNGAVHRDFAIRLILESGDADRIVIEPRLSTNGLHPVGEEVH